MSSEVNIKLKLCIQLTYSVVKVKEACFPQKALLNHHQKMDYREGEIRMQEEEKVRSKELLGTK